MYAELTGPDCDHKIHEYVTAIIVSTVRSRDQEEAGNDFRVTLGILGNFKRTNVALSRAKAPIIMVGNFRICSIHLKMIPCEAAQASMWLTGTQIDCS